jgi:hypothetical protein
MAASFSLKKVLDRFPQRTPEDELLQNAETEG